MTDRQGLFCFVLFCFVLMFSAIKKIPKGAMDI